MGVIDLEYGSDASIEDLLRPIDRPGDFCVHGKLYAPMPRLEVEGAGMLAFPVPEAQFRALIGAAGRAPYGRGPETVVDTSVRDCWQIGAEQVSLSGGAWPETFAEILDRCASGLGCPVERVEARLYKLLIYERGGFFSPHRDTEKAPGMVATLTISLPAAGEGGELIVRHGGRETAVDMNVEEPSELAFAAFYADCPHEVRPVASGHRVALVFNLCLRADDERTPREPPEYGEETDAIARHLDAWCQGDGSPEKIVWLLDHAYSEAGLSFETLKNGDDARARVLSAAADLAGCDLHAAVVHIEEQGDAMYGDEYVHGLGWDPDEEDVEGMEIGELYDSRHWLGDWVARDGARPEFGEIALLPGELTPRGGLDGVAPDERWVHEATGNEGVSLERAWRRAALVLWPRSRTLAILAGAGIGGAVAWLEARFERGGVGAGPDIASLASEIIDLWPPGFPHRNEPGRARMLRLLSTVGDRECLSRFFGEVMLPDYTGAENGELPAAMEAAGPETAGRFLRALVDARFRQRPEEILALLRRLDGDRGGSASEARTDMVRETVKSALRAVSEAAVGAEGYPETVFPVEDGTVPEWLPETETGAAGRDTRPVRLSEQALRDLFVLALRCSLPEEAGTAAGAIAAKPLADSYRALPAALEEMSREPVLPGSAAFVTLWRHAARSLLDRSAAPPREPSHWRIACDVACGCEQCAGLRTFCADSDARVARFPLRKDLRAHLHRTIDAHGLDIDHETERRGRPFTLVCTKNRRSHKKRVAEYFADIQWMRRLTVVAPEGAREIAGLRDAVEASARL